MNEEWKPVAGHEGYEVSSLGRVRNLGGRVVRSSRGGTRVVPACDLKPQRSSGTGYLKVILPDRKQHLIHRLVAFAFCSGYAQGLVVDHINGDVCDNRAENLRWVTSGFNTSRPYRENGLRGAAHGKFGIEAMKVTAVVATSVHTGEVRRFACATDAARELGSDSGAISRCCTKQQRLHKGWTYAFAQGVSGFPYHRNREVNKA